LAQRQLTIAAAAVRDLDAARRWLTQPGAGARAARRLAALAAAVQDLQEHPCRWPVGELAGLRGRHVEGHRIVYEVAPDTGDDATAGDVTVLRVFGPGQDRTDPRAG
jgi:plasmid stabilization system protein ParE